MTYQCVSGDVFVYVDADSPEEAAECLREESEQVVSDIGEKWGQYLMVSDGAVNWYFRLATGEEVGFQDIVPSEIET